jgi:hypothetical protein
MQKLGDVNNSNAKPKTTILWYKNELLWKKNKKNIY